jgi:L-fuconolactonase
MIIDGHAHVWHLDSDAYPWQPSFGYRPTTAAPPDALLSAMDRMNVNWTILVQPSVYGDDHRFLFETVRQHPERFLPVGLVDPADPNLTSAAAILVEEGCVGLRVNLSLDLRKAEAQAKDAAWAELETLEVPICVRATPAHHDLVTGILGRRPSLCLIVDHLGLPDTDQLTDAIERLAELARFERCWLKIAGLARLSALSPPYRDVWPLVQAAFDAFGSSRLLWGSDFPGADPSTAYPAAVAAIESMPFIRKTDRSRLMAGTSRQLWGSPHREVTRARSGPRSERAAR